MLISKSIHRILVLHHLLKFSSTLLTTLFTSLPSSFDFLLPTTSIPFSPSSFFLLYKIFYWLSNSQRNCQKINRKLHDVFHLIGKRTIQKSYYFFAQNIKWGTISDFFQKLQNINVVCPQLPFRVKPKLVHFKKKTLIILRKFGLLWKIQTLLNFLDPHSTMLNLELQPRVLIALNLLRFLLPCPFLIHFCLNSALPTCLPFTDHLNSSLRLFFSYKKICHRLQKSTTFKQKVLQAALSN